MKIKLFLMNLLLAAAAGAAPAEFLVGAGTHFGSGTGDIAGNLALAGQAGLNTLRDERLWAFTEWEKDKYALGNFYTDFVDHANRANFKLIHILAYGNRHYDNANYPRTPETIEAFCRYAEFSARALKGKISYYQIWNEWEGSTGIPRQFKDTSSTAEYMELLKAVAPRLRAIDPDAKIVANSISSGDAFFEEALKRGITRYVDVLALHTYNFNDGPGRDTIDAWCERMEKVGELIRKYNNGNYFDLFITEMGMPTFIAANGRTEEEQAAYLAQLYLSSRMFPFLKGIWWYDFQDDNRRPESSESNYGLVRPDLTVKPAFEALADLSGLVRSGEFIGRIPMPDPKVRLLHYRHEGRDIYALFHTYAEDDVEVVFLNAAPAKTPVRVHFAGRPAVTREWGFRDWLRPEGAIRYDDRLSFTVRALPLLIEGDLSQVKIVSATKRKFPRKMPMVRRSFQMPPVSTVAAAPERPERPVRLELTSEYRPLSGHKWAGPEDCSAVFSFRHDRDNLILDVTVTDDKFFQDKDVENCWIGDSLQMAFQRRGADEDPANWFELDAALTPTGPELFLRRRQNADAPPTKLASPVITRTGNRTKYRLTISRELFGLSEFKPGDTLAWALVINDNDGTGRKGYFHWADGIGITKDPAQFGLIVME